MWKSELWWGYIIINFCGSLAMLIQIHMDPKVKKPFRKRYQNTIAFIASVVLGLLFGSLLWLPTRIINLIHQQRRNRGGKML